jgi:hypothetical protein
MRLPSCWTGPTSVPRALPLAERASAIARKKLPANQRLRQRYDALSEKLGGHPEK